MIFSIAGSHFFLFYSGYAISDGVGWIFRWSIFYFIGCVFTSIRCSLVFVLALVQVTSRGGRRGKIFCFFFFFNLLLSFFLSCYSMLLPFRLWKTPTLKLKILKMKIRSHSLEEVTFSLSPFPFSLLTSTPPFRHTR